MKRDNFQAARYQMLPRYLSTLTWIEAARKFQAAWKCPTE